MEKNITLKELFVQDILLIVKFSSLPFVDIIVDGFIRIELLTMSKKPDYSIISNYFYQQIEHVYPTYIEDIKKSN